MTRSALQLAFALCLAGAAQAGSVTPTGQSEQTIPGGLSDLSGLTHAGGELYYAVDDQDARLYELRVAIQPQSGFVDSIVLASDLALEDRDDPEEVSLHLGGSLYVSDESGPAILAHDAADGSQLASFPTPQIFIDHLRSNFGFEALDAGPGGGFWATTEGALTVDGGLSTEQTGMALRLQHWSAAGQPDLQLVYPSEPLPPGTFAVHSFGGVGVVDIEVTEDGTLLVLERTLTGFLGGEYEIYLFEIDIAGATDVSAVGSLVGASYTPVSKTLLFQASVPSNFESMALGPLLANGERSLLLMGEGGFASGDPSLWAFRFDPDGVAGPSFPPAGAILAQDFESGLGQGPDEWLADGCWDLDDPQENVPAHPSGNRVATADNCDGDGQLVSPVVKLGAYRDVALSFWVFVDDDLENDDFLLVEVFDGNEWVEVAFFSNGQGDDEIWKLLTFDVTPYLSASFRIRFTSNTNRSWEETEVDDVLLTGTRKKRGCGLGGGALAIMALGIRRLSRVRPK